MKLILFLTILAPSFGYSSSILYSIEKDGKTSYMLGTLHNVQADIEEVHPALPNIINSSRIALFEIVTGFDRLYGFADLLEESALLGLPNSSGITPGAARKLEIFLSGLDEEKFGHIRNNWKKIPPGLLIGFLQMSLNKAQFEAYERVENEDDSFENPLSYTDGAGLDIRIKDQILENEIPIYALDGNEVYLRVLIEHSTAKTLSNFVMKSVPKVSVTDAPNIKREKDLPKEWKVPETTVVKREQANGFYLDDNPEGIFALAEHNNFVGITANKRNEAWEKKLVSEVAVGGALVVVGLGHLHLSSQYGRSLIQILEDNNFTVTAISKFSDSAPFISSSVEMSCLKILGN